MKKTLLLIVLCTLVGTTLRAATLQRAILSHQGKLTQFDLSHWLEAVDQAVKGDTIFLTAGTFPGYLTITKPITIIGAGVGADDTFYKDTDLASAYEGCAKTGGSTTIAGEIKISIPGSVILTKTLLENIRNDDKVVFTETVTNPTFKRCQFGTWGISAEATVTSLTLENCFSPKCNFENFVAATILNCYLQDVFRGSGFEFTNCTLVDIGYGSDCTFINSIVKFSYDICCCTCVNCIYDWEAQSSTYDNCWNVGNGQTLTKAQLQSGGYIGTDGTVVGPLGGSAPFTLIPAQPYVSSSTLSYNKTTKKLTVNATVNKGK